jgi:hypothetical protein
MHRISALALALVVVAPLGAQDRDRGEPFNWSGEVQASHWVYVRNLNGAVRVEPGTGTKVEITAIKSWRRGDPKDVRITVTQTGSGKGDLLVCALWNENSSCDEDGYHSRNDGWWRDSRNDVSVEFTIRLPAGVKIDASSVNGAVNVEGATADVVARTVNGGIEARSVSGSVSARTTNGSITVRAGRLDGSRTEYSTVNGSITVELPPGINADVDMRTVNGRVSSDFPLTVEGAISARRLRAKLGDGGPSLKFSTVNGSIHLRKA